MNKISLLAFILLFLAATTAHAGATQSRPSMISILTSKYIDQTKSFNVAAFGPDCKSNLSAIPDVSVLEATLEVWKKLQLELSTISVRELSEEEIVRRGVLTELLERDIQRFQLELAYKKKNQKPPTAGLFGLASHTKWYELYLRYNTSSPKTALEVFNLASESIQDLKHQMTVIQEELGYKGNRNGFQLYLQSDEFVMRDKEDIIGEFRALAQRSESVLGKFFGNVKVKPLAIEAIPNVTKNSPPAYYNSETFYFNFFNKQFPRRALTWSFLHEAIPGHHYQLGRPTLPYASEIHSDEDFIGFIEGWGAYAEDLGVEMGLYKNKTLLYGKLEWQLIRSVRMILDVRIHRDGWDKTQALTYWQQMLPHNLNIAEREIDRITNWPGQVTSYMVGAAAIKKIRVHAKQRAPHTFNVALFHEKLLKYGPLPLQVLSDYLLAKP